MKILHIGKYYPPFRGGMESYLKDLVEEQVKTHELEVIVHNHEFRGLNSPTVIENFNGYKLIRLKSLRPVLFTPLMIGLRKHCNQSIKKQIPDIIHISWPNPSVLFLLLSKSAKTVPWVIQWQSDMVTDNSSWLLKLAYKFFKPLERQLIKKASKVIVSSNEYLNHSKALQEFKRKCEVIPLALAPREKQCDDEDLNWATQQWKNKDLKVFNIGRLTFYKNHELLIDAAKSLPEAQFIIAGSGQLLHYLKTKIQSLKIDNVTILQGLTDSKINALFKTSSLFCLPSNDRAESYGLVLLEALQFKVPILVSDLPGSGMKWIASEASIGQTFQNGSINDLLIKIRNLKVKDKVSYKELAQFQISNCAHSIDMLYKSITSDRL